jgi:hypothetical protein
MRLRRSGLASREVDGDIVVLDLESSVYLTTNRSGAVLLQLLQDERSSEELVAVLVEKYDVEQAVAETDVSAFVAALAEKNLLEHPSGAQAGEDV